MPIESIRQQVLHAVKTRLRAHVAGSTYWYTPDVVELASGQREKLIPDEYLDTSTNTMHLVEPGDEHEFQRASSGVRRDELEIWVLSARRFTPASDLALATEEIIASSAWANGALTVLRSPFEASRIRVRCDAGISAGVLTVNGTDPQGAAIVGTFDVAAGKDQEVRGASKEVFATVTSASISGAAGSGNVKATSLVTREEIQERLISDVKLMAGGMTDLATQLATDVKGIMNFWLAGHDTTLRAPGWALLYSMVMVQYQMTRMSTSQ